MFAFLHHHNHSSHDTKNIVGPKNKLTRIFNAYGKIELTIFFILALIIAGLVVEHNVFS